MSLRPDDRNGRSGRSRSRNRDTSRSRSAVRVEESATTKSKSKVKSVKGARFQDEESDEDTNAKTTMRGPAFDDEYGDEDAPISRMSKARGMIDDEEPQARTALRLPPSDDEELVHSRRSNGRGSKHEQSRKMRTSARSLSSDRETPLTSKRSKAHATLDGSPPGPRTSGRAPAYAEDDGSVSMPSMPGGFDDNDSALAYDDRSSRVSGHSSLLGKGRRAGDSESASTSESDTGRRRHRRESKRDGTQKGPDIRAPKDSKHSRSWGNGPTSAVPYPSSHDSIMPLWPQESRHSTNNAFEGYADPTPYKYADPPEHLIYSAKPHASLKQYSQSRATHTPAGPTRNISFSEEANVKEVKPSKQHAGRLSVGGSKHDKRAPSPLPGSRMDRLSISGSKSEPRGLGAHGAPPASPLLEAYHGTYQSISPMPSPMMRPEDDLDDLPSLSLSADEEDRSLQLTRPRSKSEAKSKKKVKLYDAEGDADKLAKAMNHREAKTGPLLDILPDLTHDQLLALREEYKKRVKVQGRGVNISKQIKATTTGNFGKACYVTALGRWESESYWANFWYQSHSSNRELLIEALMGRSNADIREINDSFKDKRYQDSLSLCMEKELKPDKFRTAILTALEGRRQEETDTWPTEYRNRDVDTLHRALKSREGGESAILDIVIRRSNNHLREVLKAYERVHEANFARQALQKSNNLVGEVIAHILNGAINRAARDCLLLRHAIKDVSAKNKDVDLRYELLMSRLIRLHWDRLHLARVKEDYKQKYHVELEKSVEEASKGDFGQFCLRLCET